MNQQHTPHRNNLHKNKLNNKLNNSCGTPQPVVSVPKVKFNKIANCIFYDLYEQVPPYIILIFDDATQQCFQMDQYVSRGSFGILYRYKSLVSSGGEKEKNNYQPYYIAVKFYLNITHPLTKKELTNVNMILSNPNISRFFVNGKVVTNLLNPNISVLIMEYHEQTLSHYMKKINESWETTTHICTKENKLKILRVLIHVLNIIEKLHEEGIVYYDIKASNILMMSDHEGGGDYLPIFTDFGGLCGVGERYAASFCIGQQSLAELFVVLILQVLKIDIKSFAHNNCDTYSQKVNLEKGYNTYCYLFGIKEHEERDLKEKVRSVFQKCCDNDQQESVKSSILSLFDLKEMLVATYGMKN